MHEVISFRNTNTHFITDEYEIFYGPYLQASVSNYADKLMELHGQSVSDLMPENHLSLSVRRGTIDPEVIRAKYEPAVAAKLLAQNEAAVESAGEEGNGRIAAIYETNLRLVKKAGDADLNVFVDKESDIGIAVVKDIKDTASYYPYTATGCIKEVNKRLGKQKVEICFRGAWKAEISHYDFQQFVRVFELKTNSDYSYDRKVNHETQSSWTYSERTARLITDYLLKDPEGCLDKIKAKLDNA